MPRTGTSTARTPSPTSQMSASQAPTPNRFVGACSTTTAPTTAPATSANGPPACGLSESSCTSHSWVENGIQNVDQEVHRHVADRDHGDEALDLLVLALGDGTEQLGAHARNLEHDFDDDRAADQRADVEAGDGEQRETRRPQRVEPH